MKRNSKIIQKLHLIIAFLVIFQQLGFSIDEAYELFTPIGAENIQWYTDTTGTGFAALPGETNSLLFVHTPGIYYATFTIADCNNATAYFILVEERSSFRFPVVLSAASGADSYQWFDDVGEIGGETGSTYSVTEEGEYYAETIEAHCLSETPRFFVQVLFVNQPPVAVDDQDIADVNVPITGTVITNDTDPDGDELTVDTVPVSAPSHGTLVLNSDGSFVYTPEESYIGADQFTYSICDPDGLCDTAIVYLEIECPFISINDLFISQLVTPNGDGKNDVWEIADLKLLMNCYESNEVIIFNRYEEKVYQKRNYGMDGQWWDTYSTNSLDLKDSELVPSGTYFYIIILDGDKENAITGFIHVQW